MSFGSDVAFSDSFDWGRLIEPLHLADHSDDEDGQKIQVQFYASTDSRLSGDDLLVGWQWIDVSGESNREGGDRRDGDLSFDINIPGFAPGSFYLISKVVGGSDVKTGSDVPGNLIGRESFQLVNPEGADPVLVWTSCALNAIKSAGSNGKPGVPPTTGTRLMAMLSAAMLDTLASFGDEVDPYRIDQDAPENSNRDAALIGAAYRILSKGLPGELPILRDQLTLSLQSLDGSQESIQRGLAFGESMADQIIALRANDGSSNSAPFSRPSGGMPGFVWTPASSGPMANVAVGAKWGLVTPWVISNVNAFSSDGLQARPDVNLALYAEQLNEVRLYGVLANTEKTTLLRTPDQTEIALFWAYDRPGHLPSLRSNP